MKKSNKGFTIVELVIVIAVIAILAGVLIPTFSNVVASANQSAALQTSRSTLSQATSMTNTASLPGKNTKDEYQTVFFVDADKNGSADYAFGYNGNSLESTTVAGTTGVKVLSVDNYNTVLTSNKNIKITNNYSKTTDTDVDAEKTYYIQPTAGTYAAVKTPKKEDIANYYEVSSYTYTLDGKLVANMKQVTGYADCGTATVSLVDGYYQLTVGTGTTEKVIYIYTNSDFASNSYVFTKLSK